MKQFSISSVYKSGKEGIARIKIPRGGKSLEIGEHFLTEGAVASRSQAKITGYNFDSPQW